MKRIFILNVEGAVTSKSEGGIRAYAQNSFDVNVIEAEVSTLDFHTIPLEGVIEYLNEEVPNTAVYVYDESEIERMSFTEFVDFIEEDMGLGLPVKQDWMTSSDYLNHLVDFILGNGEPAEEVNQNA